MTPDWPYWLLTALLVVLCVCLGIVAYQRDQARTALNLYRDALIRADPHAALVVSETIRPGTGSQWTDEP